MQKPKKLDSSPKEVEYQKLPLLKEIDKKLRLGGLPLTVDNLKYGASTMIAPG